MVRRVLDRVLVGFFLITILYGLLFSLPEGLGIPVSPDSPWPPLRSLHAWAVAQEPAHLDPPPVLLASCLFDGLFQVPALVFVIYGLLRKRRWVRPLGLFYAGAAVTNMFLYFATTFLGATPPPNLLVYLPFNLPWLIAPAALGLRLLPEEPFEASSSPAAPRGHEIAGGGIRRPRNYPTRPGVRFLVPTVITHAVVGAALGQFGPRSVPRGHRTFVLAVLSVLPDLDVIAFHFGIPYSHWLGHRGFSHSLLFAVLVAAVAARFDFRQVPLRSRDWWYLFGLCTLAIVSHGVLDAFTDGGLGIAFLLPFSPNRYFFPFQPLAVSPIGVQNFLQGPAFAVLASEVIYVWIPLVTVLVLARALTRRAGSAA